MTSFRINALHPSSHQGREHCLKDACISGRVICLKSRYRILQLKPEPNLTTPTPHFSISHSPLLLTYETVYVYLNLYFSITRMKLRSFLTIFIFRLCTSMRIEYNDKLNTILVARLISPLCEYSLRSLPLSPHGQVPLHGNRIQPDSAGAWSGPPGTKGAQQATPPSSIEPERRAHGPAPTAPIIP